MKVNEIEVMAYVEPSIEAHRLLNEHCGICNGTCDPPSRREHALLIEIALLRVEVERMRQLGASQ